MKIDIDITKDNLLLRIKEQDWDLVIDVNLKGSFNTIWGSNSPENSKSIIKIRSKYNFAKLFFILLERITC